MTKLWNEDASFGRKLATLCCKHYRCQLKRTGKPQPGKEWTLMAAVVISTDHADLGYELKVVSMGTGSKCLGQTKLNDKGDAVHDSHAEVVARRGFLRYIYAELEHLRCGGQSDLLKVLEGTTRWQCELKSGVAVHLFTSHTPCGDASIFPKDIDACQEEYGEEVSGHNKHVVGKMETGIKRQHSGEEEAKVKQKRLEPIPCQSSHIARQDDCLTDWPTSAATKGQDSRGAYRNVGQHLAGTNEPQFTECCEHNPGSQGLINEELLGGVTEAVSGHKQGDLRMTHRALLAMVDHGRSNTEGSSDHQDIYRTGAKCLPGDLQDPLAPGVHYHVTGVLRTKPGRGDRTISLSCSDKIVRWNVVGIQGALLSHFLSRPIYLCSLVLGKCPYSAHAMERAVNTRISGLGELPSVFSVHHLHCYQTDIEFDDSRRRLERSGVKVVPAPAAVTWWLSRRDGSAAGTQEASVQGRRLGTTNKNRHRPDARVSICKLEMFQAFTRLLKTIPEDQLPDSLQQGKLTDPPSQEQLRDPPSQEQLRDPPSQEQLRDPPSQEQLRDPPSQEQLRDPPSQEQLRDPPSQEQLRDPPSQEQLRDPPSQEQLRDPPSQEQLRDPPSQEQLRDPPSQEQPRDPPSQEQLPDPPSQEQLRDPPSQEQLRDPPSQEQLRDPPSQEQLRDPPSQEQLRDPPSQEQLRDPPSQEQLRDPPSQEQLRDPPSQEQLRDPPSQEQLPDPPSQEQLRDPPSQEQLRDLPSQEQLPDPPKCDEHSDISRRELRTYEDYKQAAWTYQQAFTELQRKLKNWPRTPRHLNHFTSSC